MTNLLYEILKREMLQNPSLKGELNVFFFNICGTRTSGIHFCFNVNKFFRPTPIKS